MSEKPSPSTPFDMYGLFYRLTRNVFFAYVVIVLMLAGAYLWYAHSLHLEGNSSHWMPFAQLFGIE